MALIALQVREFRPRLVGVLPEESHALRERGALPDRPRSHSRVRFRLTMMRGHRGREGVELELEVGMAGRDHLVIDDLLAASEMATEARLRAHRQILAVVHAEAQTL